jgi:inosine/xanthosine triphosphatase
MDDIKICVGSLNPSKIEAVRIAFKKYFKSFQLYNIKAESKVPSQPIGRDVIIEGATNRAKSALAYLINEKKSQNDNYGVGIESGLIKTPQTETGYMDLQFSAIIDDNNHITIGSGNAFEHPKIVINEILSDETKEIGFIIGKLANNMNLKNENGAISFLSNNIITRTEILTHAVICALIPHVNKKLYKRL